MSSVRQHRIEAFRRQGLQMASIERLLFHDLFHATKNPLQVMQSALRLLESNPSQEQQAVLFLSLKQSSQEIEKVLNGKGVLLTRSTASVGLARKEVARRRHRRASLSRCSNVYRRSL